MTDERGLGGGAAGQGDGPDHKRTLTSGTSRDEFGDTPDGDLGDDQRGDGRSFIDLYVLVMLVLAGVAVWIAFYNPRLAAAIGFGLFVLAALVKLVHRP